MQDPELESSLEGLIDGQQKLAYMIRQASETRRPSKDAWDKVSAISILISGLMIAIIGLYFITAFNAAQTARDDASIDQQSKLARVQEIAQLMPALNGSEANKQNALLAMSALGDTELAAHFATLTPSAGSRAALEIISQRGPTDRDKQLAADALKSLRLPTTLSDNAPAASPSPATASAAVNKAAYIANLPKAAHTGDLVALQDILSHGVGIDELDGVRTPLMWAAESGQVKAVKFLLDKGANPNIRNSVDQTALSPGQCARSGGNSALTLAISWSPEFKPSPQTGNAADYLQVVKDLVGHRAKLDLTDGSGATPLMNAALFGHEDIVLFLLSNGAPVCNKSCDGRTAADFATLKGHTQIAKQLNSVNTCGHNQPKS